MAKPSLRIEAAKNIKKKYPPETPTAKLARLLRKDSPLLFNSDEDARDVLRYIEGKKGARHRADAHNHKEIFTANRPTNPYNLPDSDADSYDPYVIKGVKRLAVFSDIHVPYHDIAAVTAALDFVKKEKPDALLLNGDTLDCYQLSRYCSDPRKRNFASELSVMKSMLEQFQKVLKCKMIFKFGNHSERYQDFLMRKAHELVGVEEFELENIIQARVNGIDVVKDRRVIKANELNIIHGHEYPGGTFNPVNPARGLFLRGKVNAMQGHNHTTSEHSEQDMNGKITTTWSLGCLAELHPYYMPLNKWNHGFAVVDLDANKKNFEVRNKRIWKGKVL